MNVIATALAAISSIVFIAASIGKIEHLLGHAENLNKWGLDARRGEISVHQGIPHSDGLLGDGHRG